jgi:single-stranded DNA-binding protein
MKKTDNFSKTIKVGRIAHISDLKTNISDCRQCIYFTIAINKTDDKPDYYNCIAYNTAARHMERYIRKGCKVLVIGTESITSKKGHNGMINKSVLCTAEKVLDYNSSEAQQLIATINNFFDN